VFARVGFHPCSDILNVMRKRSKSANNGRPPSEHPDIIDEMNAAWGRELPELDSAALEVVGRVIVIAQHLERSVDAALAPHGLSLGQFDILATLRRQGPQGKMTPTQLMKSVMLSSGGMTNRLDRLEQAGLIRREEDPADRRGVVVGLTEKGRELIEAAAATRFEEARASLPPLSAREQAELTSLLRRWLNGLER
jgi:DNA-binding MarR family transcriptional regulator